MNHCIFQEDILFILFILKVKTHTEGSSNLWAPLIALKFKSSTRAGELNVLKCRYFMHRLHKHQNPPKICLRIHLHRFPYKRNNYRLPPLIGYIYGGQTDAVSGRKHQENCLNVMQFKKINMETKRLHVIQWNAQILDAVVDRYIKKFNEPSDIWWFWDHQHQLLIGRLTEMFI